MKKILRWLDYTFFEDIFFVSLISFLIYIVIESLEPGLISNYFNINILLIITIVSGVMMVLQDQN